jgi:hypothetical protein
MSKKNWREQSRLGRLGAAPAVLYGDNEYEEDEDGDDDDKEE